MYRTPSNRVYRMHLTNLWDLGEWGLAMQNISSQYFTQLTLLYLMPTLIRKMPDTIGFHIVLQKGQNPKLTALN